MDGGTCEQPYFQWDDKNCACLGCVKNGKVSDACKTCEDYIKNVIQIKSWKAK